MNGRCVNCSLSQRRGSPQLAVAELCQNPIQFSLRELLFERKQLPHIVDNGHIRMELMESLERLIVLRNQQVAGSIPAGGSRKQRIYGRFSWRSIAKLRLPRKTTGSIKNWLTRRR